jgi:hydroxyacylglutathione hydrolase
VRFALAADGANVALQQRAEATAGLRARGLPTLPSTIALECATNPFLRSAESALRASATRWLGRAPDDAQSCFAALRAWKDDFR